MKRIGEMQSYIINFTQENMSNQGSNKVENTVKRYLLRLKTNVRELNNKFDTQYKSCKDNMSSYGSQCHTPIEKQQIQLKYNNKYVKSLHEIDAKLEKTATKFYESNIMSNMKQVNKICQKDSIVDMYNKVANKLSSHFNITSQIQLEEETKHIDVNDDKQLDSFLQKVILRIHHHKLRVPRYNIESNTEMKAREAKEKFLKERSEFAQILYNKAVTYMSNAVQRKKELSCMETTLFNKMQVNDDMINTEAKKLEQIRKANADLIVSLNKDNDATRGSIKRCEVLQNISTKCTEMANIYQNILNSYDEQSEALDRIFTILKK